MGLESSQRERCPGLQSMRLKTLRGEEITNDVQSSC